MKPNYKKLAEEYRKRERIMADRLAEVYEAMRIRGEVLQKKEKELDEWMAKYVQVLNQLIDLQERVARKEGQG